jgi:hypothetical protein
MLLPYFLADAVAKTAGALLGRGKSLQGVVRAYGWIATHPRWIILRRRTIQQERKIGDREIMRWMSSKVTNGEGAFPSMVNALSSSYARIVRLAFYE